MKKYNARVSKVYRLSRTGRKAKKNIEDFDIDLEALAGPKPEAKEEKEEDDEVKEEKPTPRHKAKTKEPAPKPIPKPGSAPKQKAKRPVRPSESKAKGKERKRGHPIKGMLKPIAKRVYRSERSIFETLQNPKEGSTWGLILGHISKKWTLKDAANAIKVLTAKKKLTEVYGKFPSAFNAAQWVARETLRRGITKVVKDGTKEANG
jgi:type IV secretory pathway VirB10-like protein